MRWQELREQLDADPRHAEALKEELPYRRLALAVAQIRGAHGLTQAEFAARVGTTQSVIGRVESGRHAPNLRLLDRIASAFGWDWQVSFAPRQPAPAVAAKPANTGLEHLLNLSLAAAAQEIGRDHRPRASDPVSSRFEFRRVTPATTFYLADHTIVTMRSAAKWNRPVSAGNRSVEGPRIPALSS